MRGVALAGGVLLAGAGGAGYSFEIEPRWLVLEQVRLALPLSARTLDTPIHSPSRYRWLGLDGFLKRTGSQPQPEPKEHERQPADNADHRRAEQ